jgi:phage/plasmid-associated DNA primase
MYRKDSDLIGEFLDDVMEVDPTAKINQQTAYEAWKQWCLDNGFRVSSKKSFTQRLAERGYPEGKSGGARFYVGTDRIDSFNLLMKGKVGVFYPELQKLK